MNEENPWRNGIYLSDGNTGVVFKIEGNKVYMYSAAYYDFPDEDEPYKEGTVKFGDFGPAREEIKEASGGVENCNFEIDLGVIYYKGVLNAEKTMFWSWGFWNKLETIEWLSSEEFDNKRYQREYFMECFCPYKIQPENKGKFIWLSGPPGAGKSTTGQLLSKNSDFVYYEADCTLACLNPFVPNDVKNPTEAAFTQKPVKGYSRKFIKASKERKKISEALHKGQLDVDFTPMYPFYTLIAEYINYQHERIGGNFAVAHAVTSRAIRDVIRKVIPDCIFVILSLTEETQLKRVIQRHGEDNADSLVEWFSKIFALYEGPGENEQNTFNIDITDEMTPEDVQAKVLEVLSDNGL